MSVNFVFDFVWTENDQEAARLWLVVAVAALRSVQRASYSSGFAGSGREFYKTVRGSNK